MVGRDRRQPIESGRREADRGGPRPRRRHTHHRRVRHTRDGDDGVGRLRERRNKGKVEEEDDDEEEYESDLGSESESGSKRSEHRANRRERKRKRRSSKGRKYSDEDDDSSSSSYSEEEYSGSESESEEERRRRKRKERKRREKREREKKRRRREKEKEKDKKKKKKKEKEKKKREKGKAGAVTNSWGKYGIIRETDMWNKRPEFTAWLAEVKQLNLESLPNWEEKQMFKEFMEDHNTATFPSKKYYNLDAYYKHKMEKENKKGMKKVVQTEMMVFNDEEIRRKEMQQVRERQKAEEVEALKRSMQSGMAQAMKEQAQLREEMLYQYKLGNFEAAAAIQRRLDPDVAM